MFCNLLNFVGLKYTLMIGMKHWGAECCREEKKERHSVLLNSGYSIKIAELLPPQLLVLRKSPASVQEAGESYCIWSGCKAKSLEDTEAQVPQGKKKRRHIKNKWQQIFSWHKTSFFFLFFFVKVMQENEKWYWLIRLFQVYESGGFTLKDRNEICQKIL